MADSMEKRQRERRKQQKRREKALRKQERKVGGLNLDDADPRVGGPDDTADDTADDAAGDERASDERAGDEQARPAPRAQDENRNRDGE